MLVPRLQCQCGAKPQCRQREMKLPVIQRQISRKHALSLIVPYVRNWLDTRSSPYVGQGLQTPRSSAETDRGRKHDLVTFAFSNTSTRTATVISTRTPIMSPHLSSSYPLAASNRVVPSFLPRNPRFGIRGRMRLHTRSSFDNSPINVRETVAG